MNEFLNWEPVERRKRGAKYITWLKEGKQVLYKEIVAVNLSPEMLNIKGQLSTALDARVTDARTRTWRIRDWAKAKPEQIDLYKLSFDVLLNDVQCFIDSHGGRGEWDVIEPKVTRSYGDPNVPFAFVSVCLKHKSELTPYSVRLMWGMTAQKKRVKCVKTQYVFEGTNLPSSDRDDSSPFCATLPLGGQVKVVMDGGAKDTAQLTLIHNGSGNIPRYWDLICTVINILSGPHYGYFSKIAQSCKGQFTDMALKTLQEMVGVEKREVSYNVSQMSVGEKLTIKFLDIPDTFEENPDDVICEESEEEEDDE